MDRRSFFQTLVATPIASMFSPLLAHGACISKKDAVPDPWTLGIRAKTIQGTEIGLFGVGSNGAAIISQLPNRLPFIEKVESALIPDVSQTSRTLTAAAIKLDTDDVMRPLPYQAQRFLDGLGAAVLVIDASKLVPTASLQTIIGHLNASHTLPIIATVTPTHAANYTDTVAKDLMRTMRVPVCAIPASIVGGQSGSGPILEYGISNAISSVTHVCLATLGSYAAPSIVGVDSEDIRFALSGNNVSSIGYAHAASSETAAQAAMAYPFLGQERLGQSQGVVIYIEASRTDLKFREISRVMQTVRQALDDQLVIFGAVPNDSLSNNYRVTIIAN